MITPVSGGIVASGSKLGADTFVQTTTNPRFAPTLRDKVKDTNIPVDVIAVYELVIHSSDLCGGSCDQSRNRGCCKDPI